MRRRWILVAVPALAVLAVATAVVLDGDLRRYDGPTPDTRAEAAKRPPWTQPCWRRLPEGRTLLSRCARVTGRVLRVDRHDADGDRDAHALVVAGPRLVVVKYAEADRPHDLPSVGGRVEATGPMYRGGRGLPLVYAWEP